MALSKRNYIPHQMVITAENLNAIQDEIIDRCVTVESKTFGTAAKKIARQNVGLPVSDDTIEEGSTVALAELSGEAVDVGNGDTIVKIDGFDISAESVGYIREGANDTFTGTVNGAYTGVNFNDIDYPGYLYIANVSGHTNAPATSIEGVLMVMSEATMLHSDATVHNTLVTQVFFDRISNSVFTRYKYNGTWTAWNTYRQNSYGTCSTAAGTAAKTATVAGFALVTGASVKIKFANTNTATSPSLNVNGTGAKAIKMYGTTAAGTNPSTSWNAGEVVELVYDGTNWLMCKNFAITYDVVSTW